MKRRVRCRHCGELGAAHRWDLRACADGRRKRTARLCDRCDVKLNAWVLLFFRVPGTIGKLEAYRP